MFNLDFLTIRKLSENSISDTVMVDFYFILADLTDIVLFCKLSIFFSKFLNQESSLKY